MSVRSEILGNLQTALQGITIENGYSSDIGLVSRRSFSKDEIDQSKCPALAIDESGQDSPAGKCGIYFRNKMVIALEGYIMSSASSFESGDLSDEFNEFVENVRSCISTADLGSHALYCRSGELKVYTGDNEMAFILDLEIMYFYESDEEQSVIGDNPIYGDNQILEDIRAALSTQMASLRAAMAAGGVAPLPAAVYDSHDQVTMSLPAISIGIANYSMDGEGSGRGAASSTAITEHYDINAEIRIHSDYQGGFRDNVLLSRIMNSITNYIETHRRSFQAENNYRIITLGQADLNRSFEESMTIGASLGLNIITSIMHTQEN